jgi:hypothetical protein
MPTKPDKEKKSPGKTDSASAKESAKKNSPKPKKQLEEDDEDDLDDEIEATPASKKGGKPVASSKTKKDDDDDDDAGEDAPDEWEKPEEEAEWDPDFEEFDVPKSKIKKTGTPGKKAADDDFAFEDDELKDLFNDKDYDEEEEDDY